MSMAATKKASTAQKTGSKGAPKSLDGKPSAPVVATKPVGGQNKYTPELATLICSRIAAGESLRAICGDKEMPCTETVRRWLSTGEYPELNAQYACAREEQADYYAESIVAISDELTVEAKYQGEDVTLDLSATAVARNRLRVDARKWVASKLAPKKYGDKIENTVTGVDGGPIEHSLKVTFK